LIATGLMLCLLVPTAAAGAQSDEDYPITTTTDPGVTTTSVGGTIVTRPPDDPGSLPFTGGDTALLVALGLGAALGGVALVWFGRRSDARA
jgi:hypothetical protein